MASKKKKAAKAGAGAVAAGRAARSNPYVQRLVEDDDLRENLRTAYESARKAYERMSNGKGPTKALLDDKKTQRELREAASSLRSAADSLRGAIRPDEQAVRSPHLDADDVVLSPQLLLDLQWQVR